MDLYGKVLELERRIEALEQAIDKAAESAVVEKVKAAAKQKRIGKQE